MFMEKNKTSFEDWMQEHLKKMTNECYVDKDGRVWLYRELDHRYKMWLKSNHK